MTLQYKVMNNTVNETGCWVKCLVTADSSLKCNFTCSSRATGCKGCVWYSKTVVLKVTLGSVTDLESSSCFSLLRTVVIEECGSSRDNRSALADQSVTAQSIQGFMSGVGVLPAMTRSWAIVRPSLWNPESILEQSWLLSQFVRPLSVCCWDATAPADYCLQDGWVLYPFTPKLGCICRFFKHGYTR